MKYYYDRIVDLPFDRARERVIEELGKEGFGVVVEIDMQRAFREKLGEDFRKYVILGACNPALARRAIELEDKIGVMLPCNLVIQEIPDGRVEVTAVDPIASMMVIENGDLQLAAFETQQKLRRVVERI